MTSNSKTAYVPIFELDERLLSTTRKVHIRRLNDIFHASLEWGDLPRARRAWTILARCKEFDWRTKWRASLLVLSDTSAPSQPQQPSGRSIEFLKKLMRFYPEEQESILQEIILHLADLGKFREALDELDFYLPSFPYQENPALHSFAGLMSLRLANSTEPEDTIQSTSKVSSLRDAQTYFTRALSIDPDNVVAGAFVEEVTKRLSMATTETSQFPNDAQSDKEMDVDQGDPSTRGKRIKRTNSNE